jgi:hypothetical protein
LLQPRPKDLTALLSTLDGNDFSSIHVTTQQLFGEGVKALQSQDESKVDNVLVVRLEESLLIDRHCGYS